MGVEAVAVPEAWFAIHTCALPARWRAAQKDYLAKKRYHTTVDSELSRELRDVLRAEERALLNTFPPVQRRIALIDLVRSIDQFFLWQNSVGKQTTQPEKELATIFVYGCDKALYLFLDESTQNDMVPLSRSTPETRSWANSTVYHCGQIAACEMLLGWERAGLGKFVIRDGTTYFECTDRAIGLEAYEVEEFYWLRNFIADHQEGIMDSLMKELPHIHQVMTPLVGLWRDHYIRYQTTPEIDEYYQQHGVLQCQIMFDQESFPGQARFGGLEFDLYRTCVATLAGWMLKHLDFAKILQKEYPHLEISNIVTIHQEKAVLVGYLAASLGIDRDAAEQCLRVLTLTHTDKPQLTRPKGPPAPLIQLGKAHLLKSVAGCLNAPFSFLGASLRSKYPGDCDRAVSRREKTFRSELYSLFPQREIIRVPTRDGLRARHHAKGVSGSCGLVPFAGQIPVPNDNDDPGPVERPRPVKLADKVQHLGVEARELAYVIIRATAAPPSARLRRQGISADRLRCDFGTVLSSDAHQE